MISRIAHMVGLAALVAATALVVADADRLGVHVAVMHTLALICAVVGGAGWLTWRLVLASRVDAAAMREQVERAIAHALMEVYRDGLVHGAERSGPHLVSLPHPREDD